MRLGKPVQNDVSSDAGKQVKMYNCISLHTDLVTAIKQDVCFYENTSIQKPVSKNVQVGFCTIALTWVNSYKGIAIHK